MEAEFLDIEIVDIDVDTSDKDDRTGRWRIPMALNVVPPPRWMRLFDNISKCDDEQAGDCHRVQIASDRLFVWCDIEKAEAAREQAAGLLATTNDRYRALLGEREQLQAVRDAVYAHAEGQHPKDAMHLSGEHRAVLSDVSDHVDRLLADDGADLDSEEGRGLMASLREGARHFGADYPDLSKVMDRLIQTLNSMGI